MFNSLICCCFVDPKLLSYLLLMAQCHSYKGASPPELFQSTIYNELASVGYCCSSFSLTYSKRWWSIVSYSLKPINPKWILHIVVCKWSLSMHADTPKSAAVSIDHMRRIWAQCRNSVATEKISSGYIITLHNITHIFVWSAPAASDWALMD